MCQIHEYRKKTSKAFKALNVYSLQECKNLLTEIYKVKMSLSRPILSDVFRLSENSSYSLRYGVTVNRRNIIKSKFGFETVITSGAVFWNDLPAELINAESLDILKEKIKFWGLHNCLCKMCRKLIKNLGYV